MTCISYTVNSKWKREHFHHCEKDAESVQRKECYRVKKNSFILEVLDNQNQSWQGTLEWVQGRKKVSFRSALELLRMIDSVVGSENEGNSFKIDQKK